MTNSQLMLEAFAVSIGVFLIVAIIIVLWRFSGVPLNQYRDADCPDGADEHLLNPSDVGLDWIEVSPENSLGNFPAWFVAADAAEVPRKMAILVHGRGGSRASCLEMLPAFKQAGYSTMTITYRGDRGAPESPDGLDHLGSTEWRDLEAAVELADLSGAQEISLFGRSAGGQIVGQFLRYSRYAELVTSVILDDPVLDWQAVLLNNRPRWLPKWVGRLILLVASARIRRPMSSFDLTKNTPLHRPRMLIIHGRRDEVVPFESTVRFIAKMARSWDFQMMPMRSTHGLARESHPRLYDDRIKSFLTINQKEAV